MLKCVGCYKKISTVSCPVGKISLPSPFVIDAPTRGSLSSKTKVLLFLGLANLNNKSNVCEQLSSLFPDTKI